MTSRPVGQEGHCFLVVALYPGNFTYQFYKWHFINKPSTKSSVVPLLFYSLQNESNFLLYYFVLELQKTLICP